MALSKKSNQIAVLTALIKKLGISVSSYTIKSDLENHPDYPGLLSLSDSLTSWNIPNQAIQLDKEACNIDELPLPLIAHLQIEGGQLLLVNQITKDIVQFSNEAEQNGELARKDFLENWDGIILYAEKEENSGEPYYTQALVKGFLNQARLPFLISVLLSISIYAISQHVLSLPYFLLFFVTLLGVTVSTLLLMQSIDADNPLVQNLCSLGKKNDCNAILKSDAAKVTSWLSWSEVGMFYFAGFFFCLLFKPTDFSFLSWLTLLSLPYTIYSIGYQIKVKNWCVLCCSVQALLWSQALIFLFEGSLFNLAILRVDLSDLIIYSLCFLLPVAIWSFIKPFFIQSAQLRPLKNQLKKFKYNSDLFNQILSSQQKYEVPDELMPIILGNPAAETVITMVSNPFCAPCATAHRTLDRWLTQRDDIQVKVVFTTSNQDNDMRTKVARHVTALSMLEDKKTAKEALNDWYEEASKDYDKWAMKFPVTYNEGMTTIMDKQKTWCEQTEIAFTPTILVNGYKLTDPYRLDDIEYLIA
ncbi:hypothetical protein ABIE26_002533 [Pedobacter africanus]|uniref:Uncharacterized protein n=1 Tax=Pedobacter africanus TaxID=151894 RepID=A0ACC6KXI8_9SPHI|nr:thioredoxin domain-containing protein [Pedobacter africanus]MDR6784078.1 hypothetical protein [Pedobacter africanus]